jgi:glyoxylase-like metal-dependent hydrolase (beta-lactamase superfamily II)
MTGPAPATWEIDPSLASAREIVPGIWRLRLPLSWVGIDHVNAYVIARDDGVILIDCGPGGHSSCLESLKAALEATGHGLTDVRVLGLTHAHSDHAGLARTVLAASGAELWAHPSNGHFYDVWHHPARIAEARRRRAQLEGVPEWRLDAYADLDEELLGVDGPVVPDQPMRDGVLLASQLGPWEVIETPGHAPSHVALFQRDHGLLLAGDMVCVAFVPWMDYGCSPDPYAESLAALDRLAALQPVALTLPGHGRPITDLAMAIAAHRAGFAARLDTLRAELALRSQSAYALTERIWGAEDDIPAVGHLTEVLCLLRHLRLNGELVRTVDGSAHRYRLNGSERGA